MKKETAIRRLHKALRQKYQGQLLKISWAELDGLLNAAQSIEMDHIFNSYNDGYNDATNGLPNQTTVKDESNTNL